VTISEASPVIGLIAMGNWGANAHGRMISAMARLIKVMDLMDRDIGQAMNGNICRCAV
jgi:aerobic-type carbon monoxide dehydrogenase small subunit (CoxS/CutS family)